MNIQFDDLTQVYQRITFERFLFDKCKMKKNTGCMFKTSQATNFECHKFIGNFVEQELKYKWRHVD